MKMSKWQPAIVVMALIAFVGGAIGWFIGIKQQTDIRLAVNYPEGVAAVVPLGFSVGKPPVINGDTGNPLAHDPTAVQEGKKLFASMNCAGCHGYKATGGMGPDLTDTAWRYGGTPIDMYKSVYEGRPQGMPAWGNAFPAATIWQLVSYIQSLGGAAVPSEANQGQGAQAGQKP